jgi:hypothetical protein
MDRARVIEDKRYQDKWFIDAYAETAQLNRVNYIGTRRAAMRRYTGPGLLMQRETSTSVNNVLPFRYHFPGGMEHPTGAQRDPYGLLHSAPKPRDGYMDNAYVSEMTQATARMGFPVS